MTGAILWSSYKIGDTELKNRIVMAPMTRSRAIDNVPNQLMAEYYCQRATAGLIITEGTSPSPNGLGYCRIPGIFSQAQVEGWTQSNRTPFIPEMVKYSFRLMHTGRISPSGQHAGGRCNYGAVCRETGRTDVYGFSWPAGFSCS